MQIIKFKHLFTIDEIYLFVKKVILLFFIVFSESIIAQSDTMYYQYESVLLGPGFLVNLEELQYNYKGKKDSVNIGDFEQKIDLYSKQSIRLNMNTKYFSFNYTLKAFSDANFANYIYSKLTRKSIGFSYFLKNTLLRFNLYQIKGMNLVYADGGYTESFPDFRLRNLNIGGEYFFNRSFSFGKINSLLYFPKKSVSSFSILINYSSNLRSNADHSFLYQDSLLHYVSSTYNFYRPIRIYNHIKYLSYNGFEILPGIHLFFTKNQMNIPRKSHASFYYKLSINTGVYLFKGISKSIDKTFDNEDNYFAIPILISNRVGFNTKYFYLDIFATHDIRNFGIENLKEKCDLGNFGISLAYRIPFRKGYVAIDKGVKSLLSSLKHKKDSNE